ncbi:MAG: YcaO-like family protein [Pyrinomonadaceae bacterium]|nr:YcaO-like family protein [Pyrinomonadaceae bacterium]
MREILPKGYTHGTHRLVAPEQTLARIAPHLPAMGVTRLADVTGLDRLGIPVYCAIRPRSLSLQVSNGKGLCEATAKVSALMEAVEFYHFENPNGHLRRGSFRSMRRDAGRVIPPHMLPEYRPEIYFSDDYVIHWVGAEDLLTGQQVWLPACAVYDCEPMLYYLSTNGLASGNHLLEATLHALYEVIERDAVARLSVKGWWNFSTNRCRVIDLKTVRDGPVKELHDMLAAAEAKLVLIWLKSCIPINTFMAVLLDRKPFAPSSMVNLGYGTHLSLSVAATRAITEAAQTRLTFIHGAREDLEPEAYQSAHHRVYDFFDRVEARSRWGALKEMAGDDLCQDYARILRALFASGYKNIFRVDMTHPPFEIPVAKVFVCGSKHSI